MDYIIEEVNLDNLEYYQRVYAQAWKESYKGLVNNEYLELINKESEIKKAILLLKNNLKDSSKRFLLKYNNEYVGILRIRKTKYDKYNECMELGALYLLDIAKKKSFGKILFKKAICEIKKMNYNKMIVGCLKDNPSNEFYKHMGGKLVDNNILTLPNNQELIENLYYFEI